MKKQLITLIAMLLPMMACADAVEIDGIYYNLDNEAMTAEVTENPALYSGDIEIPDIVTYEDVTYSVTTIGLRAFYRCNGLTAITIPNSVTVIREYAFQGCSSLTSIIIPSNITEINRQVFDRCSGLTTVIIPNNVYIIDEGAFSNCSNLTSVSFPNSLEYIYDGAFQNCSSLTSVTIPNSVNVIGSYAFAHCSNLNTMIVENENKKYDSRENCNAIIETKSNTLVAGCMNTIIPNSVTSIGDYAFAGCCTSITIPNNVTSIGDYAFYGCKITTVEIPNSVTSIGDFAFNWCTDLTSVTIPNSVTSIGREVFTRTGLQFQQESDGLYLDNWMIGFIGRPSGDFVIREGTTGIAKVFKDYKGITSVTIPNSVVSISKEAFSGCIGLTTVTLPNNMSYIGEKAFSGCSNLVSVDIYDSENPNISTIFENVNSTKPIGDNVFGSCPNLTSVVIPNGITSIGTSTFGGCSSLTSVTIPNTVTSIGNHAFYGCSSIASVTLPNCMSFIGESAFEKCEVLSSVDVYNNEELHNVATVIESDRMNPIGRTAFYYCRNLASVVIPHGIITIGELAFGGCEKLSSITIPNTVTAIEGAAFQECSITSISIPENVFLIGAFAFNVCQNLTSINLPNSLVFIGSRAFNCPSLTSINSEIRIPFEIEDDVFPESVYADATLTIPYGKSNDYQRFSSWNKFNNIKEREDDGKMDAKSVYTVHVAEAGTLQNYISEAEKYNVIDLTLSGEINGTDLRLIRDMAGHNYLGQYTGGKLRKLDLSKVKIVSGGEMYLDTDKLRTSPYSNNYYGNAYNFTVEKENTIPKYVFSCCSLESIILPKNCTVICYGAFEECNKLKTITIPASVTTIEREAISDNILTDVYCYAKNPPDASGGYFRNATLYVPEASIEAYKNTAPWNGFKDYVALTYEPGDINGDGFVDADDVMNILNVIIEGLGDNMVDMNGDEKVDISDVIKLINILLESE